MAISKIDAARLIANQNYADNNGEVDFDDNAAVMPVDTGVWVQAWVFVANEEIRLMQSNND